MVTLRYTLFAGEGMQSKALVMGALILIAAIGAAAYFLGPHNKEPGKGVSPQDISSGGPLINEETLSYNKDVLKDIAEAAAEVEKNTINYCL